MAVSLVQSIANAGVGVASSTLSVKLTSPSSPAGTEQGGTTVIIFASDSFSVTGISPGTWTSTSGNNAHNFESMWVSQDLPGGTQSVTATFGGSTNSGAQVWEYRGWRATPTLNNITLGGASDNAWVGPFTPTLAPNLVVAVNVSGVAITAGPPGALTPLTWVGARQLSSAVLFAETAVPTSFKWIQASGNWDLLAIAFAAGAEDPAFDETAFQNDSFSFLPGVFQADSFQLDTYQVNADAFDTALSFQGDAFQPATSIGVSASAEVATGTGTANNPSIFVTPNAGNAAGTGTANAPTASVQPAAGVGTGTGVANAPTLSLGPTSQVATGTGSANAPTGGVQPGAGAATGTGAANAPAGSIQPGAGVAAGTGSANTPAAQIAGVSGVATGSGVAGAPSAGVTALSGVASGTGTAFDPTVILQGNVTANAGIATGIGTAFDATVITSSPGGGAVANPGYAKQVRRDMTRKPQTEREFAMAVLAQAGMAVGRGEAFSPTVIAVDNAQDEMDIEALLVLA